MKFYFMGNGRYIAAAGRGTSKKVILALQTQEWARRQGGISSIVELTEEHAIYYALKRE